MSWDWALLDGSHLGMLGAGAAITGVGFVLRRVLTGAASQERIARYAGLTDIASKMKAQGLSPGDVLAVEGFMRGKRREAEISAQGTPVELPPAQQVEPEGYWTQSAMNERAAAAFATADAQLHQVLLDLAHYYGDELWDVQRSWEAFRDHQVAFTRSEFEGGTIAPLIAASEGEALTQQRLAWARATLEERAAR